MGKLLIPTAAVLDEGTSFLYLPPGREIKADERLVAIMESVLQELGIQYLKVKIWTTCAPYREKPGKVKLRKAEGCLTVEMETATFLSVAQFRNVRIGQLFYGGDDVNGFNWDARQWQRKR